jgi:uncharacterized protein
MYYEPQQLPVSDEVLEALHGLLEQRAVPFKGMSLEMLDGFLNALAVGPSTVMPSEWTPLVWGPHPPRWESQVEFEKIFEMLMALWNDVVRRAAIEPTGGEGPEAPLIVTPEEGDDTMREEYGLEWAVGFLDGVELRAEAWDVWAAKEQWIDEGLWCIQALAIGEWPVPEGQPSEGALAFEDRKDLIDGLPHMLHDLNMYRFEHLVSRTPIRKAAAPGRNDPCPCGSGKKYKKCCGA